MGSALKLMTIGRRLGNWFPGVLAKALETALTAAVLFIIAFIFRTSLQDFVNDVFALRKPQAESYPLICIVEPYAGAEPRTIDVDFFIINLTAKEYTRVELQDLLRGLGSEPGHQQSSVIELNAKSPAKLAAARGSSLA